MIKVIVIDDHQIVLRGISALLKEEKEIVVLQTFSDPKSAFTYLDTHDVDVVVSDLDMPELNGEDVLLYAKSKKPDIKVILLSIHNEQSVIKYLMKLGADGYLTKNASQKEYVNAVQTVHTGVKYFSKNVMDTLLADTQSKASTKDHGLTKRELQIVELIAEGMSSKQIGASLFISPRTVETHRLNIQKKIDQQGTAGIIRFAFQSGIAK